MGVGVVTGVGGRKSGRPQAVRSATVAIARNEERLARVRAGLVGLAGIHIKVAGGEFFLFHML